MDNNKKIYVVNASHVLHRMQDASYAQSFFAKHPLQLQKILMEQGSRAPLTASAQKQVLVRIRHLISFRIFLHMSATGAWSRAASL